MTTTNKPHSSSSAQHYPLHETFLQFQSMEESEEEKREEDQDRLQNVTLALFDLLWFRCLILFHPPPPPLPPATPPPPPPEVEDAESSTASPPPPANLLRRRILHRRSLSDDLSPSATTASSTLQIRTPKLQTILSGKETATSDEVPRFEADRRDRRRRRRERRRRRRSEGSKSMSELEFEELKGLMDLGFTFSDADADPRLIELVPGLQRLKAADDEAASSCASADDMGVPRPYLSEAWDAAEEEGINRLRNFKIDPIGDGIGGGGVDLKDQLRFWAHAVASTVR